MRINRNSIEIGRAGEEYVCRYLESKGYEILCRNFKIRGGEIDIIATKDDIIAFVEVKTRKQSCLVDGFSAVDRRKKTHIIRTAETYMWREAIELQPRYDIAEVVYIGDTVKRFEYIENAFDVSVF